MARILQDFHQDGSGINYNEPNDLTNEMVILLWETIVQMREAVQFRLKKLIQMDKILTKWKEYLAQLEKDKLSVMTEEEKEAYWKSKTTWILTQSIKFEKDKEKDGEAIDIFENRYFNQFDYL